MRETSTVIDDGGWKQVWAEMTDSELEDRLFTYLWLAREEVLTWFHVTRSGSSRWTG